MPTQQKPKPLPASPFVSPARTFADIASPSLARLLGKRGLANMEILRHWPEIVGAELGQVCAPEKIVWPRAAAPAEAEPEARRGAVLHIRVEGPQAVELQHRSDEIIARVNRLFGFAAVEKIRIIQAPLAGRDQRPARRPQPAAEPAAESESLDAALARLAHGIKDR
ncbi:MAG: DciA family protein [Hyphomicrobiales bacterium]|nr:DciA family protein [Hyphomicrobiales bacterium]